MSHHACLGGARLGHYASGDNLLEKYNRIFCVGVGAPLCKLLRPKVCQIVEDPNIMKRGDFVV